MKCPRCQSELEATACDHGRILSCGDCGGSALTVELLRRFAKKDRLNRLWQAAEVDASHGPLTCPGCPARMTRVSALADAAPIRLDVCVHCHLIWFDPGELRAFSPERQAPDPADRLSIGESLGIHPETPVVSDDLWRVLAHLAG